MKKQFLLVFLLALTVLSSCKQQNKAGSTVNTGVQNSIRYAKGLEIYRHTGYTVIKVTKPWPGARQGFTYVVKQKGAAVSDSLNSFPVIEVPIKSIVVTSTTHIPSLEMLGAENTLVGFPGTDYISSKKTRALIDAGKVREVGANESLNTEVMLDLAPDVVVGFSISSDNKTMNNLQQSGLTVLYNGDWTEQTPLGKAEWIKFFGALYGKENEADSIFKSIEKEYKNVKQLAASTMKPTVLCGAIYQDNWYLPQGGSWAATFLKDAGADYLWKDSKGTGSLSPSFETVLDKAQDADFWIGPGQFTSLQQMKESNPHYAQFMAFQTGRIYSFSIKTGATGGILYYEQAQNHPDVVLKDLVKILHPELLPEHELYFFEKLK